jgi:hypothetical protein
MTLNFHSKGAFAMSKKLQLLICALALLGLVGGDLIGTNQDAWAGGATYQAKNMFDFLGGPSVLEAGAATLTRTNKGISYKIYTSGLEPGANTVWIVIFNEPQNCMGGGPGVCMGPDLANPAVQGSVVAGSGYLVGPDGIANFVGSLDEGNPPDGIQLNVPGGTANGLKNSMKAEIHLVVRKHGAVDNLGGAVTQLTTFENAADCVAQGRTCANVQAVLFEPVD